MSAVDSSAVGPAPGFVRASLLTVGSCRERTWLADGSRTLRRSTFPALVVRLLHPRAGVILFDTGYGTALTRARSAAARLYRRVLPFTLPAEQEIGVQLAAPGGDAGVAAIFLSHFHPDHVGGLRALPGVPIVCSRDGLTRLRALGALARLRHAFLPELLPEDFDRRATAIEDRAVVALGAEWLPFEEAYDLLGDGSLRAVALPGHALGQYGLICRLEGGQELFLIADAAWLRSNFADLALPALPARLLVADAGALRETLARLHALAVRRPDLHLVPSHCAASQRAFAAGGHGG